MEENTKPNYDLKVTCEGCGDKFAEFPYKNIDGYILCDECCSIYEDSTGYCSLGCCLGNGCDGSC